MKLLSLALLCLTLTAHASEAPKPASLVTTVVNDENEKLAADAIGKMLYTFDLDIGKPTSACNGNCAEVWPPYLISQDEAKILQAPLGSIERANKTTQLTLEGKPLYVYAYDRVNGDDHGDGIGGVWHYIEMK